jgi:hypothetical protein
MHVRAVEKRVEAAIGITEARRVAGTTTCKRASGGCHRPRRGRAEIPVSRPPSRTARTASLAAQGSA